MADGDKCPNIGPIYRPADKSVDLYSFVYNTIMLSEANPAADVDWQK